jgi:hypothetical protein
MWAALAVSLWPNEFYTLIKPAIDHSPLLKELDMSWRRAFDVGSGQLAVLRRLHAQSFSHVKAGARSACHQLYASHVSGHQGIGSMSSRWTSSFFSRHLQSSASRSLSRQALSINLTGNMIHIRKRTSTHLSGCSLARLH